MIYFRNRNSEFQGLLDGCLHVYLDVGSHHGIQVSFQLENLKFLTYAAIFFPTCRRFASSTSPATSRKQRCCLPSIPISERVSWKRVCISHYHAGENSSGKKLFTFPGGLTRQEVCAVGFEANPSQTNMSVRLANSKKSSNTFIFFPPD